MRAQIYSVLLTIEDSSPPSASSLAAKLKKMLEEDGMMVEASAVFGNVTLLPPSMVKKHNDIVSEYNNR
jgi:hypothetical protein